MTAKTTDFSGLLYYNPAGPGFDAVASATITGPNSMDEGATEIWELVTWAIPDGDIYYKIVPDGDNLNAGRFTGGLTGILTVTNNRTSIGITVSEDNATSITGQSFDIRFSKTLNGTPFATKYGVNVNDTSQGSATYEIIPSATSMSEGGTGITFTINTTNLSDGSQVIWWIDGIGSVNDPAWTTRFVEGVNNGTVTITSNTASFTLTAATNANVDDGAIFSIYIAGTLFMGVANSGNITIVDTTSAPTPTYALAKAGDVSSVNEGTALTFNVTTTNVADGTTLYFYVGSTGASEITAGRFSQGSGSSFTVNNNTGTFDITVSADSTTAIDTQSYNVQLSTTFSPPTFVGSAVGVTVNDTSQTPTPNWPDPGGLNGGIRSRSWFGIWDQNSTWFTTYTPYSDDVVYTTGVSFGQPGSPFGDATVRLDGYFYAAQSGSYTFTLEHNYTAWVWVGPNVATASTSNSNIVSDGGTITVNLIQGDFYPILLVYTQAYGGPDVGSVQLKVSGPGYPTPSNSWAGDGNGWY